MIAGAELGGDPFDVRFSLGLPDDSLLALFNRAGVLSSADANVAVRLGRIGAEVDEVVLLAAALAVRSTRVGHVRVELDTVRQTVALDSEEEIDVDGLAWPDPTEWLGRLGSSPLVTVGDEEEAHRPLRLMGVALYLDRHWRDERLVAASLLERSQPAVPDGEIATITPVLDRLFPRSGAQDQRWAAATAALRRLTVIAGGPGTGKTTTIARVLALLDELARSDGARWPLVALAAPTGKAAARMQEAVVAELQKMDLSQDTQARLSALRGSTVHRLLGRHPGNTSRFRHDRHNHLPHDVVVVDETSMVPAALMARLLEAVRPDARLVLLGDPQQLASVEAGAVMGDIVGPVGSTMRMRARSFQTLSRVAGGELPVTLTGEHSSPIGDGVILLRTNYRFGGELGRLASAVRDGRSDDVIAVLRGGGPAVSWIEVDPTTRHPEVWRPVRELVTEWGSELRGAALAGDVPAVLAGLTDMRVLCAHRRGPVGAGSWNQQLEDWLVEAEPGRISEGAWYPGRPVMVTANDYSLRLVNGDTGACLRLEDGRAAVVFARESGSVMVSPSRLAAVDTVYATTVHKSQGSEFATVVVLLPEPSSRILTRELLYTALTRATRRVVLAGTEESIRRAVDRPVSRASGLADLLWNRSDGTSAGPDPAAG